MRHQPCSASDRCWGVNEKRLPVRTSKSLTTVLGRVLSELLRLRAGKRAVRAFLSLGRRSALRHSRSRQGVERQRGLVGAAERGQRGAEASLARSRAPAVAPTASAHGNSAAVGRRRAVARGSWPAGAARRQSLGQRRCTNTGSTASWASTCGKYTSKRPTAGSKRWRRRACVSTSSAA